MITYMKASQCSSLMHQVTLTRLFTAGGSSLICFVNAGVTALSLLITPFLMQASNKWLLLADPEAGTLVSLPQPPSPCWPSSGHCDSLCVFKSVAFSLLSWS